MPEYTHAIDTQISDELRRRGRVDSTALPGLGPEEGAAFLRRYLELHRHEVPLRMEGDSLTYDLPVSGGELSPVQSSFQGPSTTGVQRAPSPVEQVLAQPSGKTLLDAPPSGGRVSGGLWALPFVFGAIGGLIAWALARDSNERVARQMLIFGIVMTVVGCCLGAATTPMLRSLAPPEMMLPASADWPRSATGRPVFYYFGTAT